MRILWTLLKVIIGLAIAVPLCLFVLGLVGTVIGLAFIALRLAAVGLVGYGIFRLARHLFAPAPRTVAPPIRELASVDPYYEAALRELDTEIGRAERD